MSRKWSHLLQSHGFLNEILCCIGYLPFISKIVIFTRPVQGILRSCTGYCFFWHWILHSKKCCCNLKNTSHMVRKYCLIEGRRYHIEECDISWKWNVESSQGFLHILSYILGVLIIEKPLFYFRRKLQMNQTCFVANGGIVIVIF